MLICIFIKRFLNEILKCFQISFLNTFKYFLKLFIDHIILMSRMLLFILLLFLIFMGSIFSLHIILLLINYNVSYTYHFYISLYHLYRLFANIGFHLCLIFIKYDDILYISYDFVSLA